MSPVDETGLPQSSEASFDLIVRDRKKVEPPAAVCEAVEIPRVENAVVFHVVAIDVVLLECNRRTPQVANVFEYVAYLEEVAIVGGELRDRQV